VLLGEIKHPNERDKRMSDPKKNIESIIKDLEAGNKDPDQAWLEIKKLKESYVSNLTLYHPHIENPEQSWHRIIAEYELDGIYILRDDFKYEEESSKVKKYEKIFIDLIEIFNKKRG
jgi:hypothetical protein